MTGHWAHMAIARRKCAAGRTARGPRHSTRSSAASSRHRVCSRSAVTTRNTTAWKCSGHTHTSTRAVYRVTAKARDTMTHPILKAAADILLSLPDPCHAQLAAAATLLIGTTSRTPSGTHKITRILTDSPRAGDREGGDALTLAWPISVRVTVWLKPTLFSMLSAAPIKRPRPRRSTAHASSPPRRRA